MNASPIEQLNIAPELADRLRPRRPGYDRIAEIVADYSEVALSKKGSTLEAEDIAVMFVQPALEALGWSVAHVEEFPFQNFQESMWPLGAEYRGLQVAVGVRDLRGPLSNERGEDTALMKWAKGIGTDYGLLTNFTINRIWRFSDKPTLGQPLREIDIRDYLTNPSTELDLLAAEHFYEFANTDLRQQTIEQTKVAAQVNIPDEILKADQVDLEPDEQEPSPPNLGPYGEPDGPRHHADEIMPGLSFGSDVAPRRTITALVTDRESGQPQLLLAGGTLPANTPVIQPGTKNGGTPQDKFGVVEQEIFNETTLAAVAQLDGDRPFLSTLPTGFPIAGVTDISPGMHVCKFGGGTGYSQGIVTLTQAGIEIKEDFERTITLQNAFMVGDQFTGPGDVGAPVLTLDSNQIVGVVVGHTEKSTVCLPIQPILDQLGVELITQSKRFTIRPRPSEDMAALSDSSHGQDRLGFEEYANAFVRLIQDTVPPLTIGIYGAWGSGKSFLMNMIFKQLKSIGKEFLEVEFKAWDYNGTDKLWAGLVEQIFGTMEQELGWRWQFWFNFRRNLQREWRQIKGKLLPYTLIAVGIMIAVVWLLFDKGTQQAIATGGIITFLLLLIPQLIKLFSTSASQRVVDMFAAQDYKDDIGFMGRIKSDLKDFADNLPTNTKVIVFIDDLDRCDPRKAVEVLEAIKLLLELEQFIVFLAIDARIITQAVEEHYGKILVDAEITGYEYLDKIVQIPFSIPEPPPKELRGYLGSLVNLEPVPPLPISTPPEPTTEIVEETLPLQPPAIAGDAPLQPAPTPTTPPKPTPIQTEPPAQHVDQPPPTLLDEEIVAGEVPFTPAEQQALLDYYAFLDPNPRRLKRLVNVYRLVRTLIMGQQEQTDLLNNPDNTIGWLVLCEQWPYAAHMMLEILDENLTRTADDYPARKSLMEASLVQLNQAAQTRITHNADESLRKLDLNYGRLSSFVETHLADVTMRDIKTLRPFTVNFNPALSAEVRLTLAHH